MAIHVYMQQENMVILLAVAVDLWSNSCHKLQLVPTIEQQFVVVLKVCCGFILAHTVFETFFKENIVCIPNGTVGGINT